MLSRISIAAHLTSHYDILNCKYTRKSILTAIYSRRYSNIQVNAKEGKPSELMTWSNMDDI